MSLTEWDVIKIFTFNSNMIEGQQEAYYPLKHKHKKLENMLSKFDPVSKIQFTSLKWHDIQD